MDTETHERAEPGPRAATRADLKQRLARLEVELRATEAQLHALDEAPNGAAGANGHGEHPPSDDPGADRVRSLFEEGREEEARRLVEQLVQESPTPRLEKWAWALARPAILMGEGMTGESYKRNNAWMRQNFRQYTGKWVALREGVLLDVDEDRLALHERLEQRGDLQGVLFAHL